MKAGDPPWKRLTGPNQYPPALPELKPAVEKWIADLTDVGNPRAEGLRRRARPARDDVFEPIYQGGPNQLLKIIHYPGRDHTGSDQGVGAHKDSGFVTILLQDTVAGLQVEGDGGWIDAPPVRGTSWSTSARSWSSRRTATCVPTCTRGDTAGIHRPAVGRVLLGAALSATVPVLDLPPDLADEVRGVTVDPQNPLFREVGRNFLKSRLRSHPDVAEAHHADLLDPEQRGVKRLAGAY